MRYALEHHRGHSIVGRISAANHASLPGASKAGFSASVKHLQAGTRHQRCDIGDGVELIKRCRDPRQSVPPPVMQPQVKWARIEDVELIEILARGYAWSTGVATDATKLLLMPGGPIPPRMLDPVALEQTASLCNLLVEQMQLSLIHNCG